MLSARHPLSLRAGFIVGLLVAGTFMAIPSERLRLELNGASPQPLAPVWSWANVADGNVFRQVEAWYDAHAGLRPLLVRLDNQINYSVFGESAARTSGDTIAVGPDGWLFQRPYLRHAVTPSPVDVAKGRAAVTRMRTVQDRLARRGIAFQLLVAPSKAEVYPERAPAGEFGGRDPASIVTAYERHRPDLLAAGVNLLDAAGDFRAWKAAGGPDLFPRTGIHWGYEPALRVLEDLRGRLNRTLRRPLPPFELESMRIGPAFGSDRDLLILLNPVWHDTYLPITRFPVLRPQTAVPEEHLPRLLWVGDSFTCGLLDLLEQSGSLRPTDFLYYFQTFERWPHRSWPGGDIAKIEWETYLRGFDAVIVVMTERAFDDLGWGFFEALESKLPPEPPRAGSVASDRRTGNTALATDDDHNSRSGARNVHAPVNGLRHHAMPKDSVHATGHFGAGFIIAAQTHESAIPWSAAPDAPNLPESFDRHDDWQVWRYDPVPLSVGAWADTHIDSVRPPSRESASVPPKKS